MDLRNAIQSFLQEELRDPDGSLVVDATGPAWIGSHTIRLSYSHSGSFAILVWSADRRIGVDLEPVSREYSRSPLELAGRFFHENEVKTLEGIRTDPLAVSLGFLDLWLKKEAYAKLTGLGLKAAIHIEINSVEDVSFETVPVIPAGYDARVAIL
jgi:phosphopantetheinyl transferase